MTRHEIDFNSLYMWNWFLKNVFCVTKESCEGIIIKGILDLKSNAEVSLCTLSYLHTLQLAYGALSVIAYAQRGSLQDSS